MGRFSLRDIVHKYEKSQDIGLISLSDEQIKRVQVMAIEMYQDIMDVCRKCGFQVSLSGGSALGAVRHRGFIPWDDDIDLMMPRQDYDAFLKIANEELGNKYYIATPNPKYCTQYDYVLRVLHKDTVFRDIFNKEKLYHQGVVIDVLPIDFVSNHSVIYRVKGCLSNLLLFIVNSNMMFRCKTKYSHMLFARSWQTSCYYYGRLFIGFIASVFPYKRWCFFFDKFVSSKKTTRRVSIYSGRNHFFRETHAVEVFFPFKEVSFEGLVAYVPNDVDMYLTALYGKHYKKIPPVEKREKHLCTKIVL